MNRPFSSSVLAIGLALGLLVPAGVTWAEPAASQPAASSAPAGKPGKLGRTKADKATDTDRKLINDATAELDLTADQKTKIEAIMADFAKARRTWAAEHETELAQLRSKIKEAQSTRDKATVRTLNGQLQQLEAGGPQFKVTMLKIRDVLTPEQQARFDVKLLEKPAAVERSKVNGQPAKPMKASRHSKS